MNTNIIGLIFLLSALSAFARLGETDKEVEARYGAPAQIKNDVFGGEGRAYYFKEYLVIVCFRDGKSAMEIVKPTNQVDRIDDADCLALASGIGGGGEWKAREMRDSLSKAWGNGVAIAFRPFDLLPPDTLMVMTEDSASQFLAASAQKRADLAASFGAVKAPSLEIKAGPITIAPTISSTPATDLGEVRRFEYLKPRAEKGDTDAQYELGVRYQTGLGVEKDRAMAKKWFRAAAMAGHGKARLALGSLLAN